MSQSAAITAGRQDASRPDAPRPYKCTMCDKAFHRLEHQTRHIRTHTGEKPHECHYPGCSKRFSRSDELTRHSRIHNNPGSRRGKQQNRHSLPAGTHTVASPASIGSMIPGSRQANSSGSAVSTPRSAFASPNVSPSGHYPTASYHPSSLTPYHNGSVAPPSYMVTPGSNGHNSSPWPRDSGLSTSGTTQSLHLLASAAYTVEGSSRPSSSGARHQQNGQHSSLHPLSSRPFVNSSSDTSLSSLAANSTRENARYGFTFTPSTTMIPKSQPMSRVPSWDDSERFSLPSAATHFVDLPPNKRICSRPPSPFTTPNSPALSPGPGSGSPSPNHTPLATPAHSPRLQHGWPQQPNRSSHGSLYSNVRLFPPSAAARRPPAQSSMSHHRPSSRPSEPISQDSSASSTPYRSGTTVSLQDLLNCPGEMRTLPPLQSPSARPHFKRSLSGDPVSYASAAPSQAS